MEKTDYLLNILKKDIPDIDDEKINLLIRFYELTIERNKVMNLTSIIDFEEFCIKHFLDSLQLYRIFNPDKTSIKMIDIGTGGGFPGIPLKIAYPSLDITLFDSLKKRLDFLDEVIEDLRLTNIRTVHGRAEEFGRKPEYREQFDLVVSRAVADLTTLSELAIPFCKINGSFVSYKGNKGNEELEKSKGCIKTLGGKIVDKQEFELESKNEAYARMLIRIDKIYKTDVKYPRGGGKPFKQPLYIDKG